MIEDIVIPELGESITEGTITEWQVKVGDAVSEDQPLVGIDTDKVSVDIPSPASGVLKEILVESGDVEVGAVIGRIEVGAKAEKAAPAAEKPAAAPETSAGAFAKPAAAPAAEHRTPADVLTPAVRRAVRETGVDASRIHGTGPHGRILKQDVLAEAGAHPNGKAAEARGEEKPAPAQARGPAPAQPPAGDRGTHRVKMTRLRRRIAERLKEVQNTAAILTTFNEVDMSHVMDFRKRYKDAFEKRHGVKLGFMSFFVKASIEALKAYPQVNGYIDGEDVVYNDFYDIGVAVSSERGLVVPVLRDADRLSMAEVESGIARLAQGARDGTLSLQDLSGGTFSITNGGVFGSMLSTPILNPPQSAILGMHAIVDRPVAVEGRVEVRPVMYLALSYDHRIVDGAEAVRFLVRIKQILEDPARLLLEV